MGAKRRVGIWCVLFLIALIPLPFASWLGKADCSDEDPFSYNFLWSYSVFVVLAVFGGIVALIALLFARMQPRRAGHVPTLTGSAVQDLLWALLAVGFGLTISVSAIFDYVDQCPGD